MGEKNESTDLVKDPVCGMERSKQEMKFQSEFMGKTYYFCTEADKSMFDAHPDYWVSQAEREKYRNAKKK